MRHHTAISRSMASSRDAAMCCRYASSGGAPRPLRRWSSARCWSSSDIMTDRLPDPGELGADAVVPDQRHGLLEQLERDRAQVGSALEDVEPDRHRVVADRVRVDIEIEALVLDAAGQV